MQIFHIPARTLGFCLLFLSSSLLGEALPALDVFIPTAYHNPERGRSDALRLEFQSVPVDEVKTIAEKTRSIQPKFDSKKPPEIIFYLSRTRSIEEQHRMVEAVKKQMALAYPMISEEIQIKVAYLNDEVGNKQMAEGEMAYENALPPRLQPAVVEKWVNQVSGAKAVAAFAERVGQLAYQGIEGGPVSLAAAAALPVVDAAVNYYATKYETEIGEAFQDHPVPFYRKFSLLNGLNNIYQSKTAKFLKSTFLNTAVWGIGAQGIYQMLSHHANPSVASFPQMTDAQRWAAMSLVGSASYAGGFTGLRKWKEQGYIFQPTVDLYLRANGVLYQASVAVGSTGIPEMLALLPPIAGAMWAMELAPAALAPLLPPKNDRIVLRDPLVSNRDHINAIESLESTRVVPPTVSGVRKARHEVRQLRLINPNFVQKTVAKTVEGFQSLTTPCSPVLSRISAVGAAALPVAAFAGVTLIPSSAGEAPVPPPSSEEKAESPSN
jgi:hypothetical protein